MKKRFYPSARRDFLCKKYLYPDYLKDKLEVVEVQGPTLRVRLVMDAGQPFRY